MNTYYIFIRHWESNLDVLVLKTFKKYTEGLQVPAQGWQLSDLMRSCLKIKRTEV